MRPHVHSHVAGRRERRATRCTWEGFHPRMRPCVHSQITCIRERLAARLVYTLEPFFLGFSWRSHCVYMN